MLLIIIIIVKRLPRLDSSIKSQLSTFANTCYDQLWAKRGCPENISIVQIEGLDSTAYLRNIVYGNKNKESYDALHLRGPHGARHLTYRAVQAVKGLIVGNIKQRISKRRNKNTEQTKVRSTNQRQGPASHGQSQRTNYRQSAGGAQGVRYSDAVSGGNQYSVPVGNRFDILGN